MTTRVGETVVNSYAYTYNEQDLRSGETAVEPEPLAPYTDALLNYEYNNVNALLRLTDPGEKSRKTMELVGKLFSDASVQIVDPNLKEKLHSAVGQGDWKTFWPRMIGVPTALKGLITQ